MRALDDVHADATLAVRKHPRTSVSQRLISPHRATVIYSATQRPLLPQTFSQDDRMHLALLMRAGILSEVEDRELQITDDVSPPSVPRWGARVGQTNEQEEDGEEEDAGGEAA